MVIMDSRLMLKIIKQLNQIEQKEKSIEEAELELAIQRDIEQQEERKKKNKMLSKRERELGWILHGGRYPK